jgi:D-lyxose ketol-isomerase
MKRSEINRLQREALDLLAEHRFALPPFARWSEAEWRARPEAARYCRAHQMGWDVTDFGSGRFAERGLVVFCVRNGRQGVPGEKPYAEKLLIVREGQETPFHSHKVKMEDIIVRGGGTLMVELAHQPGGAGPIPVLVDGVEHRPQPGEPLLLAPGQSITITRGLRHRFYGEPGRGTVFAGEVSQVNDDFTDNYFVEPLGRFAAIEEDEPKLFPLWNELTAD